MKFSGETDQGLTLIRRPIAVLLTLQSYLDRSAPAYSPGGLRIMLA